MTDAKKTPLYEEHIALGAKMLDFAGWALPVRYSEIIEEHHAVRLAVGIFDVSHMGEILVEGSEAEAALNYLTSNDVSKLYDGKAHYSCILNESGGVVDDIIIYRLAQDRFLIVVNAANTEKDFSWMLEHNKFPQVKISNVSSQYAQIALQGPKAVSLASRLFRRDLSQIQRFHFENVTLDSEELLIARTGYTGEDGFEFYCRPEIAASLWRKILELGKEDGIRPCGLGARDSLRLEAAYPLYGHELQDNWSALESGLGWIIKLNKPDFIGKDALVSQKQAGVNRQLVGLKVIDAGLVREGYLLFDEDTNQVGLVTSGTKTPSLDYPIAMALVDLPFNRVGNAVVG
jgi:aminomethyltransferase